MNVIAQCIQRHRSALSIISPVFRTHRSSRSSSPLFPGFILRHNWNHTSASSHFGFKSLYEPLHQVPNVDIIAIHGLDGHRELTWTAPDDAGSAVLWLRDLLPKQVPSTRILSYGYDAATRGNRQLSQQSFLGHAQDLTVKLTLLRKEPLAVKRPIIFIAHGVGGIVLEYAIQEIFRANKDHLPDLLDIKWSTYGIIYLGTPHQGVVAGFKGIGLRALDKFQSWIVRLTANTNYRLLQKVPLHAEALQELIIAATPNNRSYVRKYIYATRAARAGGSLEVPKFSAIVPGIQNAYNLGMNRDHAGLAKFALEDDGDYETLVLMMKDMVSKAPETVAEQWHEKALDNNGINHARMVRLVNSHKNCKLDEDTPDSTDVMFLDGRPQEPLRILGRTSEIASTISLLQGPAPRVAIMGPGGMGKTTLAQSVMNSPDIIAIYPTILFVACDDVTSVNGIFHAIGNVLHIPSTERGETLRTTVLTRLRTQPTLLYLDSLERPWDIPSLRWEVDGLLSSLHAIPTLALLITMRGDERPRTIIWSKPLLPPLQPLQDSDAVALYTEVSERESTLPDPRIGQLVKELDNVPLAVELIAHQARLYTLEDVWDRWQREGICLLDRRDESDGRLTSITASFKLSFNSPRIATIPYIHDIARLLAHLPSGLAHHMVPVVQEHLPAGFDLGRGLRELRGSSLCHQDAKVRYQLLGPIRQCIITAVALHAESLAGFKHAFLSFVADHQGSQHHGVIAPELSNIRHLLTESAVWDATHITACDSFLWWEKHIHGNLDMVLADRMLRHAQSLSYDPILEVRSRVRIADLLQYTSHDATAEEYLKAKEYLRPALAMETGSMHWNARVRLEMGRVARRLFEFDEAGPLLREAVNLFEEGADKRWLAIALRSLGKLYILANRVSEAEEPLERAVAFAREILSDRVEASALRGLGSVYHRTNRVELAEGVLCKAIKCAQNSHSLYEEGSSSLLLGKVYLASERWEEAEVMYSRALTCFERIHSSKVKRAADSLKKTRGYIAGRTMG